MTVNVHDACRARYSNPDVRELPRITAVVVDRDTKVLVAKGLVTCVLVLKQVHVVGPWIAQTLPCAKNEVSRAIAPASPRKQARREPWGAAPVQTKRRRLEPSF